MFDSRDDLSETSFAKVPDTVLDQAISWAVRIHSHTAGPEDYEALAVWRARQPAHEIAWQRIQAVDRQLCAVPDEKKTLAGLTLEKTFRNRSMSRRRMLKIAALAAVAVGGGLLVDRDPWWAPWRRQIHYATNIGIRRTVDLDDGSRLVLNGNTRIEVVYSPRRRMIRLKQGEVYMETGADTESVWGHREFWVETAHARLEALGTRFNVSEENQETRLHVADGAVAVQLANGRAVFHPGDTIRVDTPRNRLERIDHPDYDPMAWIQGAIVAKRMRLSDFAQRLNRHHADKVRVASDVADLLISGVFQLEGPDALDRTLNAVASSLPVKVDRQGNEIFVH